MSSAPQSGIHLRRVGVDDWQLWRKLRLQALEEAPYAFSSKLTDWQGEGDTEERWRARLSMVPLNLLADLNGTPAGMVSATAPNQDGTSELISMWVAPFARRQGVSDSLITAVIQWARGQQITRIVLAVLENNARAFSLYRRHQFVEVGAIDSNGPGIASERQMMRDLEM